MTVEMAGHAPSRGSARRGARRLDAAFLRRYGGPIAFALLIAIPLGLLAGVALLVWQARPAGGTALVGGEYVVRLQLPDAGGEADGPMMDGEADQPTGVIRSGTTDLEEDELDVDGDTTDEDTDADEESDPNFDY